ncbi:MAG TPA: STAS domain-containing protein [Herpetosiphonaceae bacterium]
MITQRRATLLLMGGMIAAMVILVFYIGLGFERYDIWPVLVGIAGMSGLFWAVWRGWEPAGLITLLLMTGLIAVTLPTQVLSPTVILPPVFALVMTSSRWVAISTATVIIATLIRSGGTGPYADPISVLLFGVAVAGMILGREVLDNARRAAEAAAAQADEARRLAEAGEREAQRQSALLAEQNASQERLLALVQELEVPVITVLRGVLVVPLIGALDTRRSETIEAAVLKAVYAQRAATVIIDLTAVTLIDTAIAQRLLALTRSVQLLGAEAVLTGLGAALAQTLVGLGVNMAGIKTYASLQAVLEDASRASVAA